MINATTFLNVIRDFAPLLIFCSGLWFHILLAIPVYLYIQRKILQMDSFLTYIRYWYDDFMIFTFQSI